MTDTDSHLTEDDRQSFADGTLAGPRIDAVREHLRRCHDCAADVAKLEAIVTRARSGTVAAAAEDLWPAIRARIEQTKVVPLGDTAPHAAARRSWMRTGVAVAVVAAAAAALVMVLRPTEAPTNRQVGAGGASTISLVAAMDSAHAYQEEARLLLDRMELQRASLRPEAAAAFDHDLHLVDGAIGDLETAIATDPANTALRQLLAASYRQKVDLLRSLGNAG